jgi:CheY-like chemotaxis protein/two-component sensor histidine kinase
VTLENERVDVKRVVHEAVEQVRPFIEERDHRLGLHLPSQSPYVMGDAKRLVQVFANLLNNAAKYTNPRGNIAVRMEVTGSTVVVKVSDNGVGMSARTAGIAFDLFAQGERTADRTQGGLGIGLALVKSLVKLHQGEVVAASAGSGQGSEFTVSLPRVPEQPELFDAGAEQAGRSMNGALRVLVVDDNKDAADTLAMLVETFGHRVEVHHDSRSALESAQIQRPHVCLLDIGLPDMDGNALARALRRQPATQDAMLVAVTGYGQDQDRAQTADAGFDHHLVKPVDAAEIRAILAKAGTREPSLSV